jgi:hypothetical protein
MFKEFKESGLPIFTLTKKKRIAQEAATEAPSLLFVGALDE